MEEDIVILGAFEVYLLTNELQDLVENLRIIDKYHFFNTNLDFDEIEQFDETVEHQLSLLFAYKKYLSNKQGTAMEKVIRAGDSTLLELFKSFQKHADSKTFLQDLNSLAEKKTSEMYHFEKKMLESNVSSSIIAKNQEILETFHASKFLKKVKYYHILEKLIENNHYIIRAAFEIYEMNKDKADFIENIHLIYTQAYKSPLI